MDIMDNSYIYIYILSIRTRTRHKNENEVSKKFKLSCRSRVTRARTNAYIRDDITRVIIIVIYFVFLRLRDRVRTEKKPVRFKSCCRHYCKTNKHGGGEEVYLFVQRTTAAYGGCGGGSPTGVCITTYIACGQNISVSKYPSHNTLLSVEYNIVLPNISYGIMATNRYVFDFRRTFLRYVCT